MSWYKEVEEISARRQEALKMGGKEKIQRQHAQGKLTARERMDLLFDSGTFIEYGMLAKSQSQRPEMLNKATPADGVITGYGKINGRMACAVAEDFTVMGGVSRSNAYVKKPAHPSVGRGHESTCGMATGWGRSKS